MGHVPSRLIKTKRDSDELQALAIANPNYDIGERCFFCRWYKPENTHNSACDGFCYIDPPSKNVSKVRLSVCSDDFCSKFEWSIDALLHTHKVIAKCEEIEKERNNDERY